MVIQPKTLLVIGACAILIFACSILKKEDAEKEVRTFIQSFQQSLSLSEEEILKQFEAKQSRQSITAALKILTNKEHEFIECNPSFALAEIAVTDEGTKVTVPTTFTSKDIEQSGQTSASLILWLKQKGKSYVISRVEAEPFYKAFAELKMDIEWSVDRRREELARLQYYEKAKALKGKYDSVVYYATYQNKLYFYVVIGDWKSYMPGYYEKRGEVTHKMGMVDAQGTEVVPVGYDLLGTIGFAMPNIVEVKQQGKVGYFDIEERAFVVPVEYDMIIPYQRDNILCLVKNDDDYGWISSHDREYHQGLPNEALREWIAAFKFIPHNLHLDGSFPAICEIPTINYAGFGVIMPPSHLVRTGILDEFVEGISTGKVPLHGWTDYVETKKTVVESVTQSVQALITTIKERYLEGREEFYEHNKLIFVSAASDTLAVSHLNTTNKVNIRKLENGLLEVSYLPNLDYYFEDASFDAYVPTYKYFTMTEGRIQPVNAYRTFAQTEFVELDSSYFMGDFQVYSEEKQGMINTSFYSLSTLEYMRNEILASYGYIFKDPKAEEQFRHVRWYVREHTSLGDVQEKLNDIDRHNLALLTKLIDIVKAGKPV